MAISASSSIAGGLALAETTITREPSTGRSVVTNPSSSLSTNHWLASDPSEHKIGKITDLMIDSNGSVTAAIISLGVAQKDVVIPVQGAESLDSRRQGLAGSQSHQRRTKDGSRLQ